MIYHEFRDKWRLGSVVSEEIISEGKRLWRRLHRKKIYCLLQEETRNWKLQGKTKGIGQKKFKKEKKKGKMKRGCVIHTLSWKRRLRRQSCVWRREQWPRLLSPYPFPPDSDPSTPLTLIPDSQLRQLPSSSSLLLSSHRRRSNMGPPTTFFRTIPLLILWDSKKGYLEGATASCRRLLSLTERSSLGLFFNPFFRCLLFYFIFSNYNYAIFLSLYSSAFFCSFVFNYGFFPLYIFFRLIWSLRFTLRTKSMSAH